MRPLVIAALARALFGSVATAAALTVPPAQARQPAPTWDFQITVIGKVNEVSDNSANISSKYAPQGWEPVNMAVGPDGTYSVLLRRPRQ